MKRYLLSIYQPDGDPPADLLAAVMADLDALAEEMQAAGVWVFSASLHPASTATVVRDREALLTDGSFTEGKEHLGGFTVINAPDLDAALAWAARMARASTLPVEVRPVA